MIARTAARRPLVKGLAGFLFGFCVSLLIAAALALNMGWARQVEQTGIDWSTRLSLLLQPGLRPAPATAGHAPRPIVFLDLDTALCQALVKQRHLCVTERIGHPEVLTAVGHALKGSGAEVVLLDFRTPALGRDVTPGGAAAFLDAWAAGEGPLVVAALAAAPGDGSTLAVDWAAVPGQKPAIGRLRYAPAVTWLGDFHDGRVRYYPVLVETTQLGAAEEISYLPSLAFAAASYAREGHARRNAVDCVFYASGKCPPLRWAGLSFRSGAELQEAMRARQGSDARWGERFLYTLPSQVPRSEGAAVPFSGALVGNYERRSASDYLAGGTLSIPPGQFANMVVIVGSSAAAANDWHSTPLGRMTGAEVVANATRAFETYRPVEQPGFFETLAWKLSFAALAAVITGLAWVQIGKLSQPRRRRRESEASRLSRMASHGGRKFAIFAAAFVATVAVVVAEAAVMVTRFPHQAHTIDLLFPVLAVFMEAWVNLAGWVLDRLEDAAAWIVRLANRLRSGFKSPKAVSGAGDET